MHPWIKQQVTFLYTPNLAATGHVYEEVSGLQLELDQGSCPVHQVSADGYLIQIQHFLHPF